ncbi:MAG: cobyrinate a,c-diamide synthase [Alphaproteobacteria bacterium]|nr:cobyrinate a,c-diamide synthase [Alphaproteobacteria bacterium]
MTEAARGWVLAAPSSNSGKTLVSAALLRLLAREGERVTPFKVGPDYIDPGFLSAAAGSVCHNLDPWAMAPARLNQLLQGPRGGRFLIEGVMGLFDGALSGEGSTADLAAAYHLPVVLVINTKGQGASVAALAQGFAQHRREVNLAGVIFTQVGSQRHRKLLHDACADVGIRVFGALAADASLVLQARHLGLVQAGERADLDALLDRAADNLANDLDLARLRDAAAAPALPTASAMEPVAPLGQRIAVARDIAFGFCYHHVLEDWRGAGAEISFFSPLANEPPEPRSDAVYLPGGYPELHAGALAANHAFLSGLRDAAARGAVILGECGGYMVLGEGVVDQDGGRHAMAGLLGLETSFAKRRLHLGYRQARLTGGCALGAKGAAYRGHEFHYANIVEEEGDALFTVRDALGQQQDGAGLRQGGVMGSFIHLIDRDDRLDRQEYQ